MHVTSPWPGITPPPRSWVTRGPVGVEPELDVVGVCAGWCALACVRGGLQDHAHEMSLRGFLAKTLQRCDIMLALESTLAFEEGTGNERGSLEMDVTSPRSLLSEQPGFGNHGLTLDLTITNLACAPSAIDASKDVAVSALVKAISREHLHYRRSFCRVYKLGALAFSTCRGYGVGMHRVPRGTELHLQQLRRPD